MDSLLEEVVVTDLKALLQSSPRRAEENHETHHKKLAPAWIQTAYFHYLYNDSLLFPISGYY
jgi:hypothetical protein